MGVVYSQFKICSSSPSSNDKVVSLIERRVGPCWIQEQLFLSYVLTVPSLWRAGCVMAETVCQASLTYQTSTTDLTSHPWHTDSCRPIDGVAKLAEHPLGFVSNANIVKPERPSQECLARHDEPSCCCHSSSTLHKALIMSLPARTLNTIRMANKCIVIDSSWAFVME